MDIQDQVIFQTKVKFCKDLNTKWFLYFKDGTILLLDIVVYAILDPDPDTKVQL